MSAADKVTDLMAALDESVKAARTAALACKWCGASPVVSKRSRLCEACFASVQSGGPSDG